MLVRVSLAPFFFGAIAFVLVSLPLDRAHAAQDSLAVGVDADTMIAFDANSNALPPPVGTGNPVNGAFGNGVEQSTAHGGLAEMHIRGGDPQNPASITAKPLIRFALGPTAGVSIDPGLPYFVELETAINANSNDTFRIYAINDSATRSFDEGALTWDNAPAVATEAFQDFEAAGSEVGIFFRPSSTDNVSTRIRHPLMGSQISTFSDGANSYATFGLTSTEINRWVIKSKEAGIGDGANLFTYDVIESASNGAFASAATWGSAPSAANLYRVNSGHTVTVDGAGTFDGEGIVVNDGTLSFSANDVALPLVVINPGGTIVNSTGTSLSIGDPTATEEDVELAGGGLIVNRDLTYSAAVGQEDLSINIPFVSYNDFTFNGVAGSDLTMRFPATHRGTIHFNGSGDTVVLTNDWGIGGTLVMNSMGANTVKHNGGDSEQEFDKGTIIFNQSGVIDHSADEDGLGDALQGVGNLVANAALIVDVSREWPIGGPQTTSRRFDVTRSLSGSAPITVVGTTNNPAGQNNSLRIGVSSARYTDVHEVSYSGTISTQDYAIVEARAGLPKAKVVVNQNGLLTTGFEPHENVPHQAEPTVRLGEIVLAAESSPGAADGGQLDVGFRTGAGERAPQTLRLTKSGGQNGSLTMNPGSSLVMQINGDPDHIAPVPGDGGNCSEAYDTQTICAFDGPVFDMIKVEGNAILDGELVIHLNANVPFSQFASGTPPPDPDYYPPTAGDTWDIITAVSSTLAADFDGINGVDAADLAILQGAYGISDAGDADGDGDTDGSDFLIWQRQNGLAASTGTITGSFDTIIVVDTLGDLSPTQTFQVNYVSSTLVQLELIDSSLLASSAVPEPSTILLLGIAMGVSSGRTLRTLQIICHSHDHLGRANGE